MYLFSVFMGVGAYMVLAHIWRSEDNPETLDCVGGTSYIILVTIVNSRLYH